MGHSFNNWNQWLWSGSALVAILVVAMLLHRVAFAIANRIVARTRSVVDDSLVKHASAPIGLILPIAGELIFLPELPLPSNIGDVLNHVFSLFLIGSIAWLLVRSTNVIDDVAQDKYAADSPDIWRARRVQTQIQVLRRIIIIVVWFVAFSMMLMTFPDIRHLGATLFASAGIVGVVIGIACKPALSNLISGLQLALAEPIRLKDLVTVDGETGTIEEIHTTYVVVRTWDLRAFIVPLSYFIEKSFQNLTYKGTDLLGIVWLYVDYDVSIDGLRNELNRILSITPLWDGKTGSLQLTEATDRTLQLRALVSASDGDKLWDLRCFVREKLITFLQQNFPESLPKVRVELASSAALLGEPLSAMSHNK